MKKLFTLLLFFLIVRTVLGQAVPDVIRTPATPAIGSNKNNRTTVDANLYAAKNLRIPRASAFTLNNAKDSIGYIMFNTTSNRFGVYRGSGVWDTYLITSDTTAFLQRKLYPGSNITITHGLVLDTIKSTSGGGVPYTGAINDLELGLHNYFGASYNTESGQSLFQDGVFSLSSGSFNRTIFQVNQPINDSTTNLQFYGLDGISYGMKFNTVNHTFFIGKDATYNWAKIDSSGITSTFKVSGGAGSNVLLDNGTTAVYGGGGAYWALTGTSFLTGFTTINNDGNIMFLGHNSALVISGSDTTNSNVNITSAGGNYTSDIRASAHGTAKVGFSRNSDAAFQGFNFARDTLNNPNNETTFHNGINFKPAQYDDSIDSAKMTSNPLAIPDVQWVLAHGGSGGSSFYQHVQANGTSRTQRANLNFLPEFTVTDNSPGTDISINTIAQNKITHLSDTLNNLVHRSDTLINGYATRKLLNNYSTKAFNASTYQPLMGFTAENIANKTATVSASTTTYPNWLGVENYAVSKVSFLGDIYNKTLSTSDFSTNGVTASQSGNNIIITGSANNYQHSLDLKGVTMLDKTMQSLNFVAPMPSSTTYGVGVGTRSINTTVGALQSMLLSLDLTNTGSKGTLTLQGINNGDTVLITASNKLSFAAGDSIEVYYERSLMQFTVRAVNKTTPQTDVSAVFNFPATFGMPNTGNFAIFSKTSTPLTITSFKVFSQDLINADIVAVGDSKAQGATATTYSTSTLGILSQKYDVVNAAGGADGTKEMLAHISEDINLKPKVVLLMGPWRNDIGFSVNSDTTKAHITTMINALQAANIPVYITTGWWDPIVNQTSMIAWAKATYPTLIIDTYTPTAYDTGSVGSDLIHPSDIGYAIAANAIFKSGKLPVKKDLPVLASVDVMNIATTVPNILGKKILFTGDNAANVTGVVLGINGGTGIANTGKTITLGGNLTTSGAFATTLTSTAATTVTLPTTGTLATLAGTETLTNKTISGSSNTLSNIANASLTNSSITINGTAIVLGASGTVAAAAGTLTGTTLASGVTASSLTSVGTLSSLNVSGAIAAGATSTLTGGANFGTGSANFTGIGGNVAGISGGTQSTGYTANLPNKSSTQTIAMVSDIHNPPAAGTTGQALLKNSNTDYDYSWTTLPGGGDALTTNPLSQFAATTSAQLRGVLSDETGTGFAYFQGGNAGTPSALVGTNISGTAASLTAGTVTTNANLTGEATSVGNATTLTNSAVIGKVLTGYTSGSGTVASTDNLLQAIQKLNGNDGLAVKYTDTATAFTPLAHRNANNTFAGTNTFNKPLTLAANASPSYNVGSIVYDTSQSGNGLFTAYGSDSNVGLQIGQEEWIFVNNNTGSTIANGAAVYVSGSTGGVPTIALAKGDASTTTIGIGITTESIANGATGYVTTMGIVHQLDTHLFSVGPIYISATTAGALTQTAPLAPNYRYRIGFVTVVDASVGQIQVTPSTASLGNGTANQFFAMNNAGTAQETKGFTVNQGLTLSFATPGVAQLGMASISPGSIKPSVVYQTPIAITPTTDSVGVKEGGKWFATTIASLGLQSALTFGTGVQTALGVNIGSAGAFVSFNGAGGTPSSLTGTNITGLPLTSGVTGILPIANGGTGTASPGNVAGTNITVTGTWPNQTINASGSATYATPSASITFTAIAGSATSGIRSDGAPKADSTVIAALNHFRSGNVGINSPSAVTGNFQIGADGTNGNFRYIQNGGNSGFGIYDSANSLYYGFQNTLNAPISGWVSIGGWYKGLGILANVASGTTDPIFGVNTNTQTTGANGVGGNNFGILSNGTVTTFNNTLDNGSGAATFTKVNKLTLTAPTTAATLTLVTGSTLQTSGAFTLNLTTTASSTPTFPTGTGTLAYKAGTNVWTGQQTLPTFLAQGTASAINSTATATAAQVATGFITSTSAALTTITLPTAASLVTQLAGARGMTFEFTVDNSAGANIVTVVAGTNTTSLAIITGSNILTIAAGSVGVFRYYFTSTTTAVLYRIG